MRKMLVVSSFGLVLSLLVRTENSYTGQQTNQQPKTIRARVALVQTDIMVFDHEDRFVGNLTQDQFDFRVDGRPQTVSFFDVVSAGTPRDEKIWARMERRPSATLPAAAPTLHEGRTILFFVDDWHLSVESMLLARKALQKLIDDSLGVNDRAALAAASGQLGFLQQFTSDKAVLRAAAAKLAGGSIVEDATWPPMNEAHAARIMRGDPELESYFVNLLVSRFGPAYRQMAVNEIRERVRSLANLSAEMGQRSILALRDFVRSASVLPGRKLVFYLSDEFALQPSVSDLVSRMAQLTTSATNAGVVIYTLDTRGLVTGMPNIRNNTPPPVGTLYNPVFDFQDGLNTLAADTGGRFLKNTNDFHTAISTAMAEASRYYLLGWYADPDSLKPGKYWSLKVSIKDRPDLKVRLRAGQVDLSQTIAMDRTKPVKPTAPSKNAADELKHAVEAPFQIEELPVAIHAAWIPDAAQGVLVALAYQVDTDVTRDSGRVSAEVLSAIGNKDGVTVDKFTETLTRSFDSSVQSASTIALKRVRILHLDPGLYQIRVAARDPITGRLGSAWQWLEVPNPEDGTIHLSSIFLRELGGGEAPQVTLDSDSLSRAPFDIQRQYSAATRVGFYASIYGVPGPDIQIQVTIFQGNQPITETPAQVIAIKSVGPNPKAVPVTGTLAFNGLAAGSYILQVSVRDPQGNTTISQRIPFRIK